MITHIFQQSLYIPRKTPSAIVAFDLRINYLATIQHLRHFLLRNLHRRVAKYHVRNVKLLVINYTANRTEEIGAGVRRICVIRRFDRISKGKGVRYRWRLRHRM